MILSFQRALYQDIEPQLPKHCHPPYAPLQNLPFLRLHYYQSQF